MCVGKKYTLNMQILSFIWFFALVVGVPLCFVQDGRLSWGNYVARLKKMVEDPHKLYLPTLIDAYSFEWVRKDDTFVAATSLLLQQVDGNDTNLLSASQKHKLWVDVIKIYQFDPQKFSCLAIAMLQAMTYIGNADTLRAMRWFARTARKHDPAMSHLVQEFIAALDERLQSESGTHTLLRASALTTPPDTLLRPASGATQSITDAPNQLLRAAPAHDNTPLAPAPAYTLPVTTDEAGQRLQSTTGQDNAPPT